MQHQYKMSGDHEHTGDYAANCDVCDGGLAICKVCGLVEGCLTTDCPGENVYAEKNETIYNGQIDYRNGQWVNEPSPHSPLGIHLYAEKLKAEIQCEHGHAYPLEGDSPSGARLCNPDGSNPNCPNCKPDSWAEEVYCKA